MADIKLQLFADGAAESGAEDGAKENRLGNEEITGAENHDDDLIGADDESGEESFAAESKKGTKTNVTSNTLEARKAEFEKLISGEYKEEFKEKFQSIFNERFRDYKGIRETLDAQQPIIDMLMQKYNIRGGDLNALRAAFDSDDEYWEEAAAKEGMSAEQFRELSKLRAENEKMRAEYETRISQNYVNQQMNEWFMQGEELKSVYPDFDFRSEIANRDFTGLLKAGIPMRRAYELIHMDEIMDSVQQKTEKRVVENIRSKGKRPDENGLNSPNGFVLKKDVSSLTREERRELARRAQRGETIKF